MFAVILHNKHMDEPFSELAVTICGGQQLAMQELITHVTSDHYIPWNPDNSDQMYM